MGWMFQDHPDTYRFRAYTVTVPMLMTGLAAILLAAVLIGAPKMILLLMDLASGRPASREGHLTTSYDEEVGEKFWYVIGDDYFEVDKRAHALGPEGHYRLYYAPRARMLLSLEPLS
jgi:hypothetical protein